MNQFHRECYLARTKMCILVGKWTSKNKKMVNSSIMSVTCCSCGSHGQKSRRIEDNPPLATAPTIFADKIMECFHWNVESNTTCVNVINPFSHAKDSISWEVQFRCATCKRMVSSVLAERQEKQTGIEEGEVECTTCNTKCCWKAEFAGHSLL